MARSVILTADDLRIGLLVTVHSWKPCEVQRATGPDGSVATLTTPRIGFEGQPLVVMAMCLPYIRTLWLHAGPDETPHCIFDIRQVSLMKLDSQMLVPEVFHKYVVAVRDLAKQAVEDNNEVFPKE